MDKPIQAIEELKRFDETVQRLEEGFVSHAQFARANFRHVSIVAAAVAAAVSVVVSVLAAIFRS